MNCILTFKRNCQLLATFSSGFCNLPKDRLASLDTLNGKMLLFENLLVISDELTKVQNTHQTLMHDVVNPLTYLNMISKIVLRNQTWGLI